MGIKQYIKDKNKYIKRRELAVFSMVLNNGENINPEELLRQDKKYCFSGIYNVEKTKVKDLSTGEIFELNENGTINIDGHEYAKTSITTSWYDAHTKCIDFATDSNCNKNSILELVDKGIVCTPLSNTILTPLYNTWKVANRAGERIGCSIATCKGCAQELNNSVHKTLINRKKLINKIKPSNEDENIHNF